MASDMVKVGKNVPLVPLPKFMASEGTEGTEQLSQYVSPPMLKIVQSAAEEELKTEFGVGTVIMTPDNVVIAEVEERDSKTGAVTKPANFVFTPLFFYPEFVTWNPIALKGKLPSIEARSLDQASSIAQKCRNATTRVEEFMFGDKTFQRSHQEHLNFVCKIEGVDEPMIISFARSWWKIGKALARTIKMRNAPIYGCRFQAVVNTETNELGTWYILAIDNPLDENPWTAEENYPAYKDLHEKFKNLYAESKIISNYAPEVTEDRSDF